MEPMKGDILKVFARTPVKNPKDLPLKRRQLFCFQTKTTSQKKVKTKQKNVDFAVVFKYAANNYECLDKDDRSHDKYAANN